METKDIGRPSRWVPMQDLQSLAALGKLAEEAAELNAIIARCIIQGVDAVNPETGVINIVDLEKEIADVQGLSRLVMRHFNLNQITIYDRAVKKLVMKQEWLAMLAEE